MDCVPSSRMRGLVQRPGCGACPLREAAMDATAGQESMARPPSPPTTIEKPQMPARTDEQAGAMVGVRNRQRVPDEHRHGGLLRPAEIGSRRPHRRPERQHSDQDNPRDPIPAARLAPLGVILHRRVSRGGHAPREPTVTAPGRQPDLGIRTLARGRGTSREAGCPRAGRYSLLSARTGSARTAALAGR